MPVFNNALAGAAGSGGAAIDEGYLVERSLRFTGDHTANLTNNFSGMSAGNRSKITFSFWAKFWQKDYAILSCGTSSPYYFEIKYSNAGKIEVFGDGLVSTATEKRFIDNNAWYHICVAIDKGHSQNSEKLIIYVNGIRQTLTANQNSTNVIYWNEANQNHKIGGRSWSSSDQGNFYLAEFYALENFVPATATDDAAGSVTGFPSASYITDLVEFDANKVVQPKEYTGSYGSRSVYLKFDDASNLGKDSSGNDKHFTVNNLSAETGAAISVASANGALPIHNTTDTYGATKGSGLRTDANASNIVLALPLDTIATSGQVSDVHATIKGSGSNKVSYHNVATDSNDSIFYGSSCFFDGSQSDAITHASNLDFEFGTGDWTVEGWFRPSGTSGDQYLVSWVTPSSSNGGPNAGHAGINIYNGNWRIGGFNGQLYNGNKGLAANTWVHVAMAREGNTLRIFINGSLVSSPGCSGINFNSTSGMTLGRYAGSTQYYFTGYMQDFRVYKGVAKYTQSFNVPAEPNLTVGANCDHLSDSPTNYTAQSSIHNNSGNYGIMSYNDQEGCTVADGGLEFITGSSKCGRSTFWANSGKWYFEFEMTTYGNPYVGIASNGNLTNYTSENSLTVNNSGSVYRRDNGTQDNPDNTLAINATGSYMVAYDLDNGKIWWGKNGTWYRATNQANQTTTLSEVNAGNGAINFSSHSSFADKDFWAPQFGSSTNSCTYKINFGQRPWAYPDSVPSGYKALCTRNLEDPEIKKPFEHFEVSKWSGNGGNNRLISTSNSPDWVWIKQTNDTRNHVWTDIVRGVDQGLYSDTPDDEDYFSPPYADIKSGGFEVDTNAGSNNSSRDYVGFSWDAGTTTDTNASGGTVTPTGLRANEKCGTSIITYTGTGNNLTLPHGLNAVPAMYIVKNRSKTTGFEWGVYHKDLPANAAQNLNYSNNNSVSTTWWNNSRPDSSIINIGTYGAVNQNTGEHVAYVFSEIPGYSKFGTFTGGNDHYLNFGFRPRWVMFKGIDAGYNWVVMDTTRSGGNYVNDWVQADTSAPQVTDNSVNYFDFFASGVKVRGTGGYFGASIQIIYAAFAEHPFKFARAR